MAQIKLDQGFAKLVKDNGDLAECPYKSTTMFQNKVTGEVAQMNQPCTANCAKFQVKVDPKSETLQEVVVLTCGGTPTVYKLEKE